MYLLRKGKQKKKKIGLHQTKKFLHSKGNHENIKRQLTEWKNILSNRSDKGLISKIYKEITTLDTKKQTTQLKTGQRT